MMIVGLGGRKGSGKSLLSSELVKNGFIKISFADPLKKIISELYSISINDLYNQDKKEEIVENPWKWNEEKAFVLSKLTKLPISCKEEKNLYSIREILQFIGTDIIRKYDDNFHVNKLLSSIDLNNNYVCDDFRFKNELDALKKHGAHTFFIIRPNNFSISNHLSEISLKWKDFDYIIYNNVSIKSLIRKFNKVIYYIDKPITFKKISKLDKNSLEKLLNDNNKDINKVSKKLNCDKTNTIKWCENFGIHLDRNIYHYDESAFYYANKESAYFAGLLSADGCIKKSGTSKYNYVIDLTTMDYELVEGLKNFVKTNKPIYIRKNKNDRNVYGLTIHSPLIIENIKHWNLKPRKSKFNEIPSIIANDRDLLKYWFLGLIDGDGCIMINKDKYQVITVKFLASEEIVDFANYYFRNSGIISYKHPEKKIKNLFSLSFHGKNAFALYHMIYDPNLGLHRKWSKITNLLNK